MPSKKELHEKIAYDLNFNREQGYVKGVTTDFLQMVKGTRAPRLTRRKRWVAVLYCNFRLIGLLNTGS